MTTYRWSDAPPIVGFILIYTLLVHVSLRFFSIDGYVSLVYFPVGLSLAVFLSNGVKYWPVVTTIEFALSVIMGELPIELSILLGFIVTLESLLGYWLLVHYLHFDPTLSHPGDFLLLMLVAVSTSGLTAMANTILLYLHGSIVSPHMPVGTFIAWWQGDLTGILLLTPLLLIWRQQPHNWLRGVRHFEVLLCFGLAFLTGQVLFYDWFSESFGEAAYIYWPFIFVSWAAVRFGRHGVSLLIFLTTLQALLGAINEHGYFASDLVQSGLIQFWLYMTVMAIVGFLLALVIYQRKQIESALQVSESNYRELMAQAPDSIFVLDKQGRFVFVNAQSSSLLGYTAEEFFKMSVREIVTPEELQLAELELIKLVEGEIITAEHHLRHRNSNIIPVEMRARMLTSGKLQVIVRNISERKQAEERIRQLNEELERRVAERTQQLEAVNHELESFAYSVSHDLRAPLRSIDGFSQCLLEDYQDKFDSEGKDFLMRIRQATRRMGNLIDDMLSLSRVTRRTMQRDVVNLSALVEQIATNLRNTAPQRKVEWIIMPEVFVQGDSGLLSIALENLINNAWKFTGKHEQARIEFGCVRLDKEKTFYIRDDGAGFDMTYASKLFAPFQRLHRMDEFEGTGIGLATVQRILGRHGGRIWAEGAIEKGATFYFTLPL